MNNKCLLVYESIYNGNTVKLARAMAQTLGCPMVEAEKALTMNLDEYQTIGLGSGIYFGRHHPRLFEVAGKLSSLPQDVFIFSSRGNPFLGEYHKPLKDILTEKGKRIIGEFSVTGYDATGPWVIIGGGHKGKPDEKDLRKAALFARKTMPEYCMPDYYLQLDSKLPIRDGEPNSYIYGSNGSSVLLKGDRVTFNHTSCTGCGRCVQVCPLGIIHLEDRKAITNHELDCTLCSLCVDNCKQQAITLHYNWRDAIRVARRHALRTTLY
jgi:ferredoxin